MLYLSQLLNKPVYYQGQLFGKVVDMAVFENRPHPPISKLEIERQNRKLTISPQAIAIKDNRFILKTQAVPLLPFDTNDFYLAEDLLDKQVIDIDGRRLVRVNDVLLESNGELKVAGIDIGFPGILRRLGLGFIYQNSKILPWNLIETFDYQTGQIQLKLKQTKLPALHPSEIAEILEDAGTKERLGIVSALDAKKAALAIEEADNKTQLSILESLSPHHFSDIIKRMHIVEIADIFRYLNPLRAKQAQTALGDEKVKKMHTLLQFSDDVAGRLMRLTFYRLDGNKTVKEAIEYISENLKVPETLIVIDGSDKIMGVVQTKDLLLTDKLALLKDIISDKKFVYAQTPLSDVFRLFAEYNLRIIPVIDNEKKPIGIVVLDDMLKLIEEQQEKE